jgi:S-adenosylmethionine:tRNA ribosyltransferase-isomerase
VLKPSDFDYSLPDGLIAQKPLLKRDSSRLLIFDRQTGNSKDTQFKDILNYLGPKDVLVLNQTKVFPARIFGQKLSGGKTEVLLLSPISLDSWTAISRPGLKIGQTITFPQKLTATVLTFDSQTGQSVLQFNQTAQNFWQTLDKIGHTPIPPYINQNQPEKMLRQKYQTVYATTQGSAAAPTAGLHFTQPLLKSLQKKGVQIEFITLHVGLGTFQSLRPHHLKTKTLHPEFVDISRDTATRLNQAKKSGKRIIAVGTTTTRALESASDSSGILEPYSSNTTIFIYPPQKFNFIDALITNFHLPQSSLLILVSAFTSHPNTSHRFSQFKSSPLGLAYQAAVNQKYRFFSFGDAMFIGNILPNQIPNRRSGQY